MNIEQNLTDLIENGDDRQLPVPDTSEPMVSRSLRLPLSLDERLRAMATERDIPHTTLMREILEAYVADADTSAVVRLSDVQRAIARLAHPA
ncbi:hypothetical protein [Nocardia sp. NPDC020380]|uniref:hypothetical protein n=1 Tax=Nocardia sp. NPDC020380 TaxID=3364309 RepID=UPI00379F3CEB